MNGAPMSQHFVPTISSQRNIVVSATISEYVLVMPRFDKNA